MTVSPPPPPQACEVNLYIMYMYIVHCYIPLLPVPNVPPPPPPPKFLRLLILPPQGRMSRLNPGKYPMLSVMGKCALMEYKYWYLCSQFYGMCTCTSEEYTSIITSLPLPLSPYLSTHPPTRSIQHPARC